MSVNSLMFTVAWATSLDPEPVSGTTLTWRRIGRKKTFTGRPFMRSGTYSCV